MGEDGGAGHADPPLGEDHQHLQRGFGDVDEAADVAIMLASNGYITGQTVNVNGGWYMS